MNATSKLIYPGPTSTHRFPCVVVRDGVPFGTLLGWAETSEIADQARKDFLSTPAVSFEELMGGK